MLHHSRLYSLDKLILYFLNCGVKLLTRSEFRFLKYLLSKCLIAIVHLLCFSLTNIHQMRILEALWSPSLGLLALQLRLKHFLLAFKRISLSYEFVGFLFRLCLWTQSIFVVLFLVSHIHVYSYLPSNTNYEKNDHLYNQDTIKFNQMRKISKHLCYVPYISRKVIEQDFIIGNFLLD